MVRGGRIKRNPKYKPDAQARDVRAMDVRYARTSLARASGLYISHLKHTRAKWLVVGVLGDHFQSLN